MIRFAAIFLAALTTLSSAQAAEDRRARVLNDRGEVESAGNWIYNDYAKGVAEATRTRKPMLVVFRCVP